jgi:hypothetical protein
MRTARIKSFYFLLVLAAAAAPFPAPADDGCVDFKWDVSKERALFAGAPAAMTAGHDLKSAPLVVPDRLYKLRLTSQDGVTFAVNPAKKMAGPVFAGLATLKIPGPGGYRIALDLPSWIDVVSNGALVAAKDFQGQHACSAPHKIVEFDLDAAQSLLLQLSNASSESVLVTITPSPSRKL